MATQEDSEMQNILKTLLFPWIHAMSEFLPTFRKEKQLKEVLLNSKFFQLSTGAQSSRNSWIQWKQEKKKERWTKELLQSDQAALLSCFTSKSEWANLGQQSCGQLDGDCNCVSQQHARKTWAEPGEHPSPSKPLHKTMCCVKQRFVFIHIDNRLFVVRFTLPLEERFCPQQKHLGLVNCCCWPARLPLHMYSHQYKKS